MNVIPMMNEVLSTTNPMIRKAPLPDFRFAPDQSPKRVRVASLDQLDDSLDGYGLRRGKQQMNVVGHESEGM